VRILRLEASSRPSLEVPHARTPSSPRIARRSLDSSAPRAERERGPGLVAVAVFAFCSVSGERFCVS